MLETRGKFDLQFWVLTMVSELLLPLSAHTTLRVHRDQCKRESVWGEGAVFNVSGGRQHEVFLGQRGWVHLALTGVGVVLPQVRSDQLLERGRRFWFFIETDRSYSGALIRNQKNSSERFNFRENFGMEPS